MTGGSVGSSSGSQTARGTERYELNSGESLLLNIRLSSYARIGSSSYRGSLETVTAYADPAIYLDPNLEFSDMVSIDYMSLDTSISKIANNQGTVFSALVPEPNTLFIFVCAVFGLLGISKKAETSIDG